MPNKTQIITIWTKVTKYVKVRKNFFTIGSGIIISLLTAFCFDCVASSGFPLAVFTVSSTVLVATVAFPQIAVGLSNNHIAKSLIPEFYNSAKHWFFLFFQVIIAVGSMVLANTVAENSKTANDSQKILMALIIFDFFYGYLYLSEIRRLILSPKDMLQLYLLIIKKNLKKTTEDEKKSFFSSIDDLGRIGRYTTMYSEKSEILKVIDQILVEVTNPDVPNALKSPTGEEASLESQENTVNDFINSNMTLPFLAKPVYPNITEQSNSIKSTLSIAQFDAWKSLVVSVYEMCVIEDESHSANNENTLEALAILKRTWDSLTQWKPESKFIVCIDAIKKLALYSIIKGYRRCASDAGENLFKIGIKAIGELSKGEENYANLYASPFIISSNVKEISIAAVRAGRDDWLPQYIMYLSAFYEMTGRQKLDYLFDFFDVVSFAWENNNDTINGFKFFLRNLGETGIVKVLDCDPEESRKETARIKRFIKAARELEISQTELSSRTGNLPQESPRVPLQDTENPI